MGRPRKHQQTEDKTGAAGPGFNPQLVSGYVRRIEALLDDIASERSASMIACKAIRADIGEVLDEAKNAGVPRRELKAAIKARDLARKIEALRDNFEAENRETYDQIRIALGDLADTPLGLATLGAQDEGPPRPRVQTAADAVAAGIKPLGSAAGAQ
jgi:hypothetical protein